MEQRTDVRKLSVLKNQEVVVHAQFLQSLDERRLEVLNNVNMGLGIYASIDAALKTACALTLTRQT